jgi:hypothetical protein
MSSLQDMFKMDFVWKLKESPKYDSARLNPPYGKSNTEIGAIFFIR